MLTTIDIDALSPRERLELIGRLWDSLDADNLPLTKAQEVELDRVLRRPTPTWSMVSVGNPAHELAARHK